MEFITSVFRNKAKEAETTLSPADQNLAILALAAGGVAAGNELPSYISRVSDQIRM